MTALFMVALVDVSPAGQTRVTISGEDFRLNDEITYAGRTAVALPTGRSANLEGLLMNARMINAAFDDDNPATEDNWDYPSGPAGPWDADRNVSEFVAQLPIYRSKGLLMVTVGLQGGNPAYETASGNGDPPDWIVSAFNADGSLKPEWMSRVARIIEAADAQGMVVNLQLFYQRQENRLNVPSLETAAKAAVDNVADWLVGRGYRNVLVEVQNEIKSGYWNSGSIFGLARAHELIDRIKARQPSLLVGTSTQTGIDPSSGELDRVIASSDFISLHANGLGTSSMRALIDEVQARAVLRADPKPVLVTEDPNVLSKMDVALEEGVSWGYHDAGYSAMQPFGNYADGFQAVPPQWRINTSRKAAFFDLLEQYTGGAAAPPPPSSEPPQSDGATIESLTLIDADTDAPVPGFEVLAPLATLNLATLPTRRLNVRANPRPGWEAAGVRFGLDADPDFKIETGAPYALAGNSGSDYLPWTPSLGVHTLTATPIDEQSATAGPTHTVRLTVVDQVLPAPTPTPTPAPVELAVSRLALVDATTDRVIGSLETGSIVDYSDLGTRQIGVVADVNGALADGASVLFDLDDREHRVENSAPYALMGDVDGDVRGWTPTAGTHVVAATPYPEADARGTAGSSRSVTFTVRE